MSEGGARRFEGLVALVIGASAGIGRAIAERLAQDGARVAIAARRLKYLEKLQEAFGAAMHCVPCDANEEQDIAAAIGQTVAHFGRLDLLFNVAGAPRMGTITQGATEDWDAVLRLTLRSAYLGIKHAAREMIRAGHGGAVVNISSVNGVMPFFGAASYSVAKAGLGMLTQNAALELAAHGIRVNALLPGLTTTKATRIILDDPEVRDLYMERIPMKRPAAAAEIAAAAVFLASADASYITGASLIADGGWATTGNPDSCRWLERWLQTRA